MDHDEVPLQGSMRATCHRIPLSKQLEAGVLLSAFDGFKLAKSSWAFASKACSLSSVVTLQLHSTLPQITVHLPAPDAPF